MSNILFSNRAEELHSLLRHIASAQCVSVVGVSNVGKSRMLRELCGPQTLQSVRPDLHGKVQFFYIDCNRMLDRTEHAFYELILRVLLAELEVSPTGLYATVAQAYDMLLHPSSEFHVPLSFNQAITSLLENQHKAAVLVFDEFDAVYEKLNPRVLLNLRALKDRYEYNLTLLTATDRRLGHIRTGEQVDEFKELFGLRIHYVQPLGKEDLNAFVTERVTSLNASFDDNDMRFLQLQAGGHPALTEIAIRQLAAVTGEVKRSDSEDWLIHRELRDQLRDDLAITSELHKIWRDLTDKEHHALINTHHGEGDGQAWAELQRKGLVRDEQGRTVFFAQLFADYVARRHAVDAIELGDGGVRLDLDSGDVIVDGQLIEPLTKLEYRLLLLLYGHLNQICDKYAIVESVWGEDYVDTVYDASIEKLVSRLRRKIEPDPANPQYIITVRGRGYKLIS